MLFNSYQFLLFFPIVLLLYFLLPSKIKHIWLLAASYYFYMSWNPVYALLMLASTLATWGTGIGVYRLKNRGNMKWSRVLLFLCLLFNLGILFIFKYLDFSISIINKLFQYIDFPVMAKSFNLLLPVGISFYTFQALGYLIDVYRGMKPEANILKYALFVSFFPQLVAGPIERSKNLLTQIQDMGRRKLWNTQSAVNGLIYMLWGYFMKMVIADRVAVLVDQVWDSYWAYGSIALIAASVGFSIQIYCDFSSYSCIAIGAAQIMGFHLMENFEAPYLSCSIKEFWRRWHVSLSTWFRDYLYIPLGGSRCSRLKRYRNLLTTFLVSGLWHGAGIGYIVWGGVHGACQIIGEILQPFREKITPMIGIVPGSIVHKIGKTLGTFLLVNFAWIFFRAGGFRTAIYYISGIFSRWDPWTLWDGTLYQLGLSAYEVNILFAALILLVLVDLLRYKSNKRIDVFLREQGALVQILFIVIMILSILIYGKYGEYNERQFIYFQF